MRKIIPYIASQFKKDKIWLRRVKPNKREFQIVVALDDSSSMADNKSRVLALQVKQLQIQNKNTSFLFSRPFPPYLLRSHSLRQVSWGSSGIQMTMVQEDCSAYQNSQKIINFYSHPDLVQKRRLSTDLTSNGVLRLVEELKASLVSSRRRQV